MSIFSDPVLSGQFLKSRGWPLYTGSTEYNYAIYMLPLNNHEKASRGSFGNQLSQWNTKQSSRIIEL